MTTVHTDHHVTLDTGTASAAWLNRAREVARQLSGDAARRDREGNPPYAEVKLLKDAGLVALLGPASAGGAGESWTTALRACREVSRADGSIGQLLGYHYLWAWAVRFFGTETQIAEIEERYTRGSLFFGGAINPRDRGVAAVDEGDTLRLNGTRTAGRSSRWSSPGRRASSTTTTGTTWASG